MKKITRITVARWIATAIAAAACSVSFAQNAPAAKFPERPVKLVVPFAAGGPNDVVARVLAQRLTLTTGQTFIVENKPGGGGIIGTDYVAKAQPDGYTLAVISAPFTMLPALRKRLPYDTLHDLTPITRAVESPMVMMVPIASNFRDAKTLLDFAKKNPEKIAYGSGGVGSTPHLTTELLSSVTGAKFLHVPYKGGGESLNALIGNQIDMLIDSVTSTGGAIRSKQVRPLAISSPARSPMLPDVPTFAEVGVANFTPMHWIGIVAPAGIPEAVRAQVHDTLVSAIRSPEVVERFHQLGATPVGDAQPEFEKFVATEVDRWKKTVKDAHIPAQ